MQRRTAAAALRMVRVLRPELRSGLPIGASCAATNQRVLGTLWVDRRGARCAPTVVALQARQQGVVHSNVLHVHALIASAHTIVMCGGTTMLRYLVATRSHVATQTALGAHNLLASSATQCAMETQYLQPFCSGSNMQIV